MAELTVFGYRPRITPVHTLDARLKLLMVAGFSLASLSAGPRGLLLLSLLLTGVMLRLGLSLRSVFREIRYVFILLAFVWLARALATPGTAIFNYHSIALTREGLFAGFLVAWRLTAVVFLGLGLVTTTRPAEIRAAIACLLAPLPFIPAGRVATMVGLVVRFLPVIFSQARETAEALRARGIERRKNPVYRIRKLALPMAWRTFAGADRLIDAMQARCYSDERSGHEFSFARRDGYVLAAAGCLCLLVAFI